MLSEQTIAIQISDWCFYKSTNNNNMLRTLLTFLLLSKCSAWFTPNRGIALRQVTTVLHSESPEFNTEKDTQSLPCWQDIYEQDCTMETIFSAGFVPSEWIKQLPCGAGMEVSHLGRSQPVITFNPRFRLVLELREYCCVCFDATAYSCIGALCFPSTPKGSLFSLCIEFLFPLGLRLPGRCIAARNST